MPENILKRMSPSDREALGKAGQLAENAGVKALRRIEREEQKLSSRWLTLNGIPFYNTRADKRSTVSAGLPDFAIFCDSRILLVEMKAKNGRLSSEQQAMVAAIERRGTPVHICRSMQEARELVKCTFNL